jgi:hypothetical protein
VRLPRQATLLQWELESPRVWLRPFAGSDQWISTLNFVAQLFLVVGLLRGAGPTAWMRLQPLNQRERNLAIGLRCPKSTPERWAPWAAASTPEPRGAQAPLGPDSGGRHGENPRRRPTRPEDSVKSPVTRAVSRSTGRPRRRASNPEAVGFGSLSSGGARRSAGAQAQFSPM